MSKFIEIVKNHAIRVDSIREIKIISELSKIEVRYSNVEFEHFYFNENEIQDAYNKLLCILNDKDTHYQPSLVNPVLFDTPIKNIKLALKGYMGSMVYHCCIAKNINTFGDLATYGKNNFKAIRNIGNKAVSDISDYLYTRYNYEWK